MNDTEKIEQLHMKISDLEIKLNAKIKEPKQLRKQYLKDLCLILLFMTIFSTFIPNPPSLVFFATLLIIIIVVYLEN